MIQILITHHYSKEKQNLSLKLMLCHLTATAVDCNSSMHTKKQKQLFYMSLFLVTCLGHLSSFRRDYACFKITLQRLFFIKILVSFYSEITEELHKDLEQIYKQ